MINYTESGRNTLNNFYENFRKVQSDIKAVEDVVYATREPKAIELLKDLRGITPKIIEGAIIAQIRGLPKKDGDTKADDVNPIFIDKDQGIIRTETIPPGAQIPIVQTFNLYGGNK